MGRRTRAPVPLTTAVLQASVCPWWVCFPRHFSGPFWECSREATPLLNNDSTARAAPPRMCLSVCLVCTCVRAGVCFPRIEGRQYPAQSLCLGCIAFNLMILLCWVLGRTEVLATSYLSRVLREGAARLVPRDPLRTPQPALCVSAGTARPSRVHPRKIQGQPGGAPALACPSGLALTPAAEAGSQGARELEASALAERSAPRGGSGEKCLQGSWSDEFTLLWREGKGWNLKSPFGVI